MTVKIKILNIKIEKNFEYINNIEKTRSNIGNPIKLNEKKVKIKKGTL